MADLWLAIAHHVLVFGLAIMLAAQVILVREGMGATDATRVARLDIGYGATAGLIVVIGILRVLYGAKGYLFYIENVWFWAKMASFALVGILSVPPTIRFRAWHATLKTNPNFAPAAGDIRALRVYILWELRLIAAIVAFAATMARYTSF